MTAVDERISRAGVYDLSAARYHGDPVEGGSLSSSGARKLLPPSCPAKFKAWVDGAPEERHDALDFGRAAHARVLGVGDPVRIVDAEDWRTKDAQRQAKEAREDGCTPLLAHHDAVIDEMAAVIRRHPVASALLDPETGTPEQAMVWQDSETGVWCRALVDFLPHLVEGQRLIVPDYKTARSAEPAAIEKSIWDYGYHCQEEWYLDGICALDRAGDIDPAFVFIVQEKTAPYVVTVIQLDQDAQEWGRAQNAAARRIYQQCVESGEWPGYSDDVVSTALPRYATYQLEDLARDGVLAMPSGGTVR